MKKRTLKMQVQVTGMTCDHCVQAVTRALEGISGVVDVSVELATGTVSITSLDPPDARAIDAVVRDAGYGVAN